MKVTKICKMCGVEFNGNTSACYCSDRCRTDYQTAYARRWRNDNIEHYRNYQKNWRKTHGKVS